MSEELKLCPFCGVNAFTEEAPLYGTYMVECWGCECALGRDTDRDGDPRHRFANEAEAIAAWNHRASPPHQTEGTSDA